jgi:nucleoside-diphosphate-sugar epimerase
VYGATKSLGEFLVDYYQKEYGVQTVGLRFTAVYGVGRDRGKSSFTTEMIRKAVAGEPYEVPYGDDILDWQYVEDVSRLILTASDAGPVRTRVFNTKGDLRPVNDGVAYLRMLAPDARLTVAPGTFGITWDFDTEPLRKELGFTPEFSMEDGIHRTFNLYRAAAGRPPVQKPR